MNPPSSTKCLLSALYATLFCCPANAAVIVQDPMEPDQGWTVTDSSQIWISTSGTGSGAGLTPRVGSYFKHFNNELAQYAGNAFKAFSFPIVAGSYRLSVDIGSFNNRPFAEVTSVGLTAGGNYLVASSSVMPTPGSGSWRTWQFDYAVLPGDPSIGKDLGFRISVPFTGESRNMGVDNVRIDFQANGASLVNGSFENPGHGAMWQYDAAGSMYYVQPAFSPFFITYVSEQYHLPAGSTYLAGWMIGGGGVVYQVDNLPRIHQATDGSYGVGFEGGAWISQLVTGLKPGTTYYVSFDLRIPAIGPDTILTVTFGKTAKTTRSSIYDGWETHSMAFVADAEIQELRLQMPDNDGNSLDNVRISEASNAPARVEGKHVMGIKVEGNINSTYRVEYNTDPASKTGWVFLKRITLDGTETWVYDDALPEAAYRFYRTVEE